MGGSSEPVELDFPDDSAPSGIRNTTYKGDGGVPVGSLFNKLLFAMKYQEPNILLSDRIQSDSKILYVRDPKSRVEKVAPWLTLDGDPYPVVADNRIQWVIDGYTTSNGYPYSTRSSLDDATADSRTTATTGIVTPVDRVNYIRNSVKATVDAYSGKVTLYTWDERGPGPQDLEERLPRHRQAALGDQRRAAHAPALPGGLLQGAAHAARELPRGEPADLLQRVGLLADPATTRRRRPRIPARSRRTT